MATTEPEIAYLDVDNPAFSTRSAVVAAAREASWYARTPYGIAVLRYDEARRLLKDRRLGQGSRNWPAHNGVEGPFADWWRRTLLNVDDAEHARQRRVLNPAFAPRVASAMVPQFRALADELVDGFAARGRCELVADFAVPFTTRVACKLFGVGEERWREVADWTGAMGLALGVTFRERLAEIEEGLARLGEFADELIAARRRTPLAGDGFAILLDARAGGRLSELELRETVVHMIFGAVETTRNQLGLAVDLFLDHPDQWALLGQRPELAPAAVEEAMRLRPTTTWVTREAMQDLEFEGVAIAKGTTLHLFATSAGTDPRAFGDDCGFDIAAERAPQLAFGAGRHHCIGHWIARADMSEALALLARRLPGIARDGEATWLPDSGNTGPLTLPVRFERAAA